MCSPCIFLIRWWRPSYAMTKAPALPPSASCAAAFSIFSAITSSFYPAFFFVLEKAVKGAGNAVIPTFPAHCPHGLQHLRHKRLTFAFTGESGYTLAFANRIAHSGLHGETRGCFRRGWYHYPRYELHVHEHPRAGCQNGILCRFWVLVWCALEEHRKPSEQRCAYARRCSEASRPRWAALLCLQLGDVAVFSLCAQYFLNVRGGGGITTLGVLYMSSKRPMPACQSG